MSRDHCMERLTTTPFGRRPLTAALVAHATRAAGPSTTLRAGKWEIFRNLVTARAAFGVSDRDLAVLNALLTFHGAGDLADDEPLIVFPSNTTLGERAHGMSESTLRRHLAALVQAGLLVRHDSPNGKRYAARAGDGTLLRAFGFDLRPLLVRAEEIARAAREVRAAAEETRRLREAVVLRLRDCAKLADYLAADAARIEAMRRALRRKLPRRQLEGLRAEADEVLAELNGAAAAVEARETVGSDDDSGRHHQSSNTDIPESDPCLEEGHAGAAEPVGRAAQAVPFCLVAKACPDIAVFADEPLRDWRHLVSAAADARAMLGISPDAWRQAGRAMGEPAAAIVVACLLQRAEAIRSPGGYLRSLTRKAEKGAFSPGPMVMALLKSEGQGRAS